MENRANEAEITLYKDMKLGETQVKAGTYTLYAIPEKDSYTIIISKDLNVWDPTTQRN
jgi:peptidyl-tRNA hydrolase